MDERSGPLVCRGLLSAAIHHGASSVPDRPPLLTDREQMELCNYANEILSEDRFHFYMKGKTAASSQLFRVHKFWRNVLIFLTFLHRSSFPGAHSDFRGGNCLISGQNCLMKTGNQQICDRKRKNISCPTFYRSCRGKIDHFEMLNQHLHMVDHL